MPAKAKPSLSLTMRFDPAGKLVQANRVAVFNNGFVLVKLKKPAQAKVATLSSETAQSLLNKAGKALNRPGLSKSSVFTGSRKIYAYSIDTENPARLVRESADGKKSVGTMVNGKFVLAKA